MVDPSSQMLSDEKLISAFQSGEEQAFSLLVQRYMPMVKKETARFRRIASDADDLAQEALLGLLSAADSYREERGASFSTYARVCIRNRVITAAKLLCGRDASTIEEQRELVFGQESDPAQLVSEKEEEMLLLCRLQKILTDTEYRVLMLYLCAYSYEEIARTLGICRKSVDNALQRAKHKLLSTPWRS